MTILTSIENIEFDAYSASTPPVVADRIVSKYAGPNSKDDVFTARMVFPNPGDGARANHVWSVGPNFASGGRVDDTASAMGFALESYYVPTAAPYTAKEAHLYFIDIDGNGGRPWTWEFREDGGGWRHGLQFDQMDVFERGQTVPYWQVTRPGYTWWGAVDGSGAPTDGYSIFSDSTKTAISRSGSNSNRDLIFGSWRKVISQNPFEVDASAQVGNAPEHVLSIGAAPAAVNTLNHIYAGTGAVMMGNVSTTPFCAFGAGFKYNSGWKRTHAKAPAGVWFNEYADGDVVIRRAVTGAVDSAITWVDSVIISPSGVVKIPALAGTGTRAVVVDANGVLSAP